MQRVALYLGVAVIGLALLLGGYCLVSGRSLPDALGNLWIPVLVALVTVAVTALRDQREDERLGSNGKGQET